MSDFETEFTVKLPCKNQNDSDRGYYFESEKTKRDMYFGHPSEDNYNYYEENNWK